MGGQPGVIVSNLLWEEPHELVHGLTLLPSSVHVPSSQGGAQGKDQLQHGLVVGVPLTDNRHVDIHGQELGAAEAHGNPQPTASSVKPHVQVDNRDPLKLV